MGVISQSFLTILLGGVISQSFLTILLGGVGTLLTLVLTYSFNKYTKKTEAYRKAREEREAAELKKKSKTIFCLL